MVFQADGNFSAFSYVKFYQDLQNPPDQRAYNEALYGRWVPDVQRWVAALDPYENVSTFVPFFRNFNQSHCLTIIDFSGTGVQEDGFDTIAPFVDSVLDRGPKIAEYEQDHVSDFFQPLSGAIRLFKWLERIMTG
jgi:hypothetical protein